MSNNRVYTCLKCAHAITDVEQHALRFAMGCPACGRKDTFGPGTFVEDFEGYAMAEAARQRASKTGVNKLASALTRSEAAGYAGPEVSGKVNRR